MTPLLSCARLEIVATATREGVLTAQGEKCLPGLGKDCLPPMGRLNGLNQHAYLEWLLTEMPNDRRLSEPGGVDRYLPWSN